MQSHFITPLRAEKLTGKWWQLTDRLVYYSALANATICAPTGFVTDFASVPRLPITYWLFGSRADAESGIHDLLYRWPFVSRKTADRIYREAMTADGRPVFTRWAMYAGVRLGGWLSYKNMPGALDYRMCKRCIRPNCDGCGNYYVDWQKCFKPGYWPTLGEI